MDTHILRLSINCILSAVIYWDTARIEHYVFIPYLTSTFENKFSEILTRWKFRRFKDTAPNAVYSNDIWCDLIERRFTIKYQLKARLPSCESMQPTHWKLSGCDAFGRDIESEALWGTLTDYWHKSSDNSWSKSSNKRTTTQELLSFRVLTNSQH